jgi:fatty acid desaturase
VSPVLRAQPTGREIARAIRNQLPRHMFRPRARQLLWIPVRVAVILACVASMRAFPAFIPLASIVMGCAIAGLAFLGHNLSHNSVVRGWPKKIIERVVWAIAFTPATVFINSHNRMHHRRADDADDAFRYFATSEKSTLRSIQSLLLYPNRHLPWNPLVALAFAYLTVATIWCALLPERVRFPFLARRIHFSRSERVLVVLESALIGLIHYGLNVIAGPGLLLWTVVIPIVLTSAHTTAYAFPHHSLRPLPGVSDPVHNSTSIKVWPVFDFLHLNISRHIAHHLFESMSSDHYPLIEKMVKEQFPESFHEVGFAEAWQGLYQNDLYKTPPLATNGYVPERIGLLAK